MIPTKADQATRELYVATLLAAHDKTTASQRERGRLWYPVAHDFARYIAGGDVTMGAGVIAALSQQKEWELNKRMADAFINGDPMGHFPDALRKAAAIMAGADPGDVLPMALKTGNFYRNILDPSDPDPVTVDRHAHDVIAGLPYVGVGGKEIAGNRGLSNVNRYALCAHLIREAAMRLGYETANRLQAELWLAQTEGTLS